MNFQLTDEKCVDLHFLEPKSVKFYIFRKISTKFV